MNTAVQIAENIGKSLIAIHRLNAQNAKAKRFVKYGKQGLTIDTIILMKARIR